MSKIAIVTDSTSDISFDLAKEIGIHIVSLTVNFDNKSYLDKIDISNEAFYQHLLDCEALPTTSQVSPGAFLEAYHSLHDEGYDTIISLHLAKSLSGTVDSARIAGKMVQDEVVVHVLDSKTATIGLGAIVLYLAKERNFGKSLDDLLALAEKIINASDLYFLLDSLDNLEKGGRIGKASFLLGSILHIKPILRLYDGFIDGYEKVRGNKENKALVKLADVVSEKIDASKPLYAAIGYNSRKESAELLKELLEERGVNLEYMDYLEIGSVVSCHIGLGAAGIAYFQLD